MKIETYARNHVHRVNLGIHLLMVPAFVVGVVLALWGVVIGDWRWAGLALAGSVVAFGIQGIGHRLEAVPPVPFAGPADFVRRVFTEQFVTFPRYVLGGHWGRAWRGERE